MADGTTTTGAGAAETRGASVKELTIRGIVLGGIITLVFTAANVYLGLKVGLTFATAIPAAVISMAILRKVGGTTIQENNIVQTVASAAGTLAAIIFVLPGLVMIGWWQGFPYWTTVALCVIGGTLGVMYSVPLRRALVTGSDLPYPEGLAAAEVLKVGVHEEGSEQENKEGLRTIVKGAVAAAGFSLLAAMKVVSNEISVAFKVGSGGSAASVSLSLALIGVGHLVGLSVGIAMLVGLVISWVFLVPIMTSGKIGGGDDVADVVSSVFSTDVRFVGAGAIAIAAIWTLIKIMGPIVKGIREARASSVARQGGAELEITERDLPISIVGGTILLSLIPIGLLLWSFLQGTVLADNALPTVLVSLVFVLVIGAVIAAVCGYMAGLIGSSNSPISGVGIVVILVATLMLMALHGRDGDADQTTALIAYALFVTAVVFSIATISNDNLQDLKTGQLVGATPWKQQVALVIGVVFGSIVIAPVLGLLNSAFGFQGTEGATDQALAAPQASLISALAKGVLGGDLNWGLIGLGALIGAVVIIVDEVLGRAGRFRLPPLAVGMGLYLPMALTLLITVGAVLGHFYDKWADGRRDPEHTKRLGVLMATGLIVGESLFGVVFAGIVAASGSDAPLAVVPEGFASVSGWLGTVVFAGLVVWLYRSITSSASRGESAHQEV